MAIVTRLQLALWRQRINLLREAEDFFLLQLASPLEKRGFACCLSKLCISRPQLLKLTDEPAGFVIRHATNSTMIVMKLKEPGSSATPAAHAQPGSKSQAAYLPPEKPTPMIGRLCW